MISVIIPVYNGEKHIPAMLGFLRAQETAGMAFEVVFVNDGSKDASLHLLRQAEKSENFPVRVVDRPNGGVSAARNAGLGAAQGDHIAFADVDDVLASDYIANLAAFAQEKSDVVRFGFTRVDENASSIPPAAACETADKTPSACQKADKNAMLRAFLADPKLFGPYGFLFTREFLSRHSLLFAEGYAYYEDYDFIVRAMALADDLRESNHVLYAYRQAAGSAMMRYNAERVHCLSLADELCAFLSENSCAAAADFSKWYKARLYWAALWQACMALPSPADAARFIRLTGGKALLSKLAGYPSKKVALTAVLGRIFPWAYALMAKFLGGRHSLIKPMSRAEADMLFAELTAASANIAA